MKTTDAQFRVDAIASGLLPDDFEVSPVACDESNNFGFLVDEQADHMEQLEILLANAQSQLLSIRAELNIPTGTSLINAIRALKNHSEAEVDEDCDFLMVA